MKLNLLTKFVNISGKHENYVEYLYLYACTITQGITCILPLLVFPSHRPRLVLLLLDLILSFIHG